MTTPRAKAKRILAAIMADLTDRRGIRQAFEGIDDEVMAELRETLIAIIEKELAS